MSILPTFYEPTKSGFKKYVSDGGVLDFADFRIWERKSQKEIIGEKINRFHSAMIFAYEQAMYYKSIGDQVQYEVMIEASEIRSKQLSFAHQELDSLNN